METVPGVPGLSDALLDRQEASTLIVSLPGQKRSREDEPTALDDKKWPGWPGDNVYRLIVPTHKVGSIIGRKGEFVKKMCEETRSRIKILDGLPGTPERVVMVSARDELEATVSPAMDGLLKVHKRIVDGFEGEGDGSIMHPSAGIVTSRLLVAATQAGNLIGRQGTTIKSIQDAAGASVRVLSVEEVPSYALPDDRVVEIQGEAGKVLKAMELVVSHLRKFLVDRSILPLFEVNRTLQSQSQQAVPQASWGPSSTAGTGLGGAANYNSSSLQNENYYQPADTYDSQMHHSLSMYGRDPGGSGLNTQVAVPPPVPIITQVTQKMQIPLSYADSIIGSAGANISYMRRTSGATITIQETRGGHGEMTVEIHGTATQVQTAQQLVQNSMAGASVPVPSYTPVEPSYGSYNSQSLYSSATGGITGLSSTPYGSAYSGSYGY